MSGARDLVDGLKLAVAVIALSLFVTGAVAGAGLTWWLS